MTAATGGQLRIGLHGSRRCGDRVGRLVEADRSLVQRIAAFFANPDKTVLLLRPACSPTTKVHEPSARRGEWGTLAGKRNKSPAFKRASSALRSLPR